MDLDAHLLAQAAREPWRADAACADHPHPEWWFPQPRHANTTQAYAVCASCPVRLDCLEAALVNGWEAGVWGGESERTRRRMRRERGLTDETDGED